MNRGRHVSAEIYGDGFVVDEQARRTFDIEVDPETIGEVECSLAGIRPDVSRFLGIEVNQAEGPGFLRYPTGGFYRAHRDRFEDAREEFPRRVSVVLFLTTAGGGSGEGRCEGGSLLLHGTLDPSLESPPLDIPPVAGTLVAFPSTRLHEVLPVTAGVRDAIVDWFY
jgi:predicted 2-oxoglutarate/Fe(II)-dependent dioxygenase YbiX